MDRPAAKPERASARTPRSWQTALIAAFLLFQIAMPLRYYLGGRGTDERFSWRMFSSVRMQRCSAAVDETIDGRKRDVALGQALHVAWVGMLERYRPAVVDAFLLRRCRTTDATHVHFRRTCINTDGTSPKPIEVALDCAQGVPKEAAP